MANRKDNPEWAVNLVGTSGTRLNNSALRLLNRVETEGMGDSIVDPIFSRAQIGHVLIRRGVMSLPNGATILAAHDDFEEKWALREEAEKALTESAKKDSTLKSEVAPAKATSEKKS